MSGKFTAGAKLFEEWKEQMTSGKPPTVFPVGVEGHPLNAVEIGPGQVVLVGAPPAAGKTALVMQMVFDAVHQTPTLKALVCNVEMSSAALMDRQLSRLAGIPLELVRRREVGDKEGEPLASGLIELKERAERVAFLRLPFDLANVARSADKFGADLILLDYVQRIGPPREYADKRLSLNAVMDAVRTMADAGCAVLVVSAVGRQRDGYGKSGYENLNLASFRESSELEYGADSAYLLLRAPDSDDAVLKCVKNRHGEPTDIPLTFSGTNQRFDPAAGREDKMSAELRGLWKGEADEQQGEDW